MTAVTASSRLSVDLSALSDNYRRLTAQLKSGCCAAAVVKADAYGLGLSPVAGALETAGATLFFVATLEEGLSLRKITDCRIAVLNGLFKGAEDEYVEHRLIPVLNTQAQIDIWDKRGPCFWQVDTGMNRLGVDRDRLPDLLGRWNAPDMILSHLACAEDTDHPMNGEQRARFAAIAANYPQLMFSLANSSGIFLGEDYHFDIVRPGMALYGLNPTPARISPMRPVVRLDTRVLQIHTAKKGETAGYGASYTFSEDTILATVSLGYADGFLRSGSGQARLFWQGVPCPIVGRVSMDLIIVSLKMLPDSVRPPVEGDWLEVIGPSRDVDALAAELGTIGYEVLTALDSRLTRIYKNGGHG